MNRLKLEQQQTILSLLVEGNSIRSIERLTGVHRDTIVRLMLRVGENCQQYMDQRLKNLWCEHIECDEIWTYVGKKQGRVRPDDSDEMGDQYVFIALDRDTKLIPAFVVGKRDAWGAFTLMKQLKSRVVNTFQLTTDMFIGYKHTVGAVFGLGIHYAQLKKKYHGDGSGREGYNPARLKGVQKNVIIGRPDRGKICTSYVERQNLTIRMQSRRFGRLTNAFSKTLDSLKAALAIHFWHYNFVRVHRSLKQTPAMAAGLTATACGWAEVLG